MGSLSGVSADPRVALGALTGIPVEPFPALGTTPCSFLLFCPLLDPMHLHILQILDHVGMVRDAIDNVGICKIPQPLAGKVIALKTPRHFLLTGTFTNAALQTMGEYLV